MTNPGGRPSLAIFFGRSLRPVRPCVIMVPAGRSLAATMTSTCLDLGSSALICVVRNAATRPHPTATTIRTRFFCFMVLPLGDKKTLVPTAGPRQVRLTRG